MPLLIGRRSLLRAGIAAAALPALRSLAFAAEPGSGRGLLVHVFLGGGMDGLNFLSPADDADFNDLRAPGLRVLNSGDQAGARLDARPDVDFRLHPRAAPLAELWRDGRMAIWPACGVPQATRSHFEAQGIMGWGQGRSSDRRASAGWLARWAEGVAGRGDNGSNLLSLSAQNNTAANLMGARRSVSVLALDAGLRPPGGPFGEAMLTALHAEARGPAAEAGREALAALANLNRLVPNAPPVPAAYAESAGFGRGLATIAQLARLNPDLTAASLALEGWDTHADQGGTFTEKVQTLVRGLMAFDADLRDLPRPWTVLVASEFGRRLRNNRSNGTDHGRAGTVFAISGGAGRRFGLARHFGAWPGLRPEALEEGVDLRVATDYRDAFRQVALELAPGAPPPFSQG